MESTSPKPFVFVLMPFSEEFDDVYKAGIKPACSNAGTYCERVDEQNYEGRIIDRIYNQIDKADIVVADMTGRNANVFYEVGYAHALNKRAVLLTKSADDIPFDLNQYPHIVYEGKIHKLKEDLQERVEWMLRQPRESAETGGIGMQPFADGTPLNENPVLSAEWSIMGYWKVVLDLQNRSESITEQDQYRIGFITPSWVEVVNAKRSTPQPNGNLLNFMVNDERRIFPGDWASCELQFKVLEEKEIEQLKLK